MSEERGMKGVPVELKRAKGTERIHRGERIQAMGDRVEYVNGFWGMQIVETISTPLSRELLQQIGKMMEDPRLVVS